MAKAKEGDRVRVHYLGRLKDGSTFDSTEGRDPLEFVIGEGRLIPGFEKAVVGMEPGEKKTEEISKDKAYGDPRPELRIEVGREQIPGNIEPTLGQRLEVTQQSGRKMPVTVTHIGEHRVVLDANHPLAGQDVTFDIDLVAIV